MAEDPPARIGIERESSNPLIPDATGSALAPGIVLCTDPNHPPVDKHERIGWYMYDWANSAVSSVVISGFLPLLIQECALAAAGFPAVCPNVVRGAIVQSVFNGTSPMPDIAYVYNGEIEVFWPSTKCRLNDADSNVYCPGFPGNSEACLTDGMVGHLFPLRVTSGGGAQLWEPSAFTSAMVSISVGLQMFTFITLGGFADFGPWRKHFLVGLSCLGSLLCIICVGVNEKNWWAGGLLMVLINVAYGTSYVFYDGWLPLLAANDPETLAAPKESRDAVFMARMAAISSNGFAIGYTGSVICLLICVAITIISDTAIEAYRINVMIAGIWWTVFACFTYKWLKPRPGPPLPAGANYFIMPWKDLFVTLSRARELKQTFYFLICWFIYSDGFSVISSVGAQYANSNVNWQPLGKGLGLAALLLIVPIFAAIGNVFWQWVAVKYKATWTPNRIIIANCLLMALVPIYGLLGFANRSLGFRRWYDMYLGVILYGFNLGSVQSVSRAAFASMIPEGSESRFFALYEFTNKGSSWIGPGVVAAVLQSTGNMRTAFVYPVVTLILTMPFVANLDFAKAEKEATAFAMKYETAHVASRGAMSVAGQHQVGHERNYESEKGQSAVVLPATA